MWLFDPRKKIVVLLSLLWFYGSVVCAQQTSPADVATPASGIPSSSSKQAASAPAVPDRGNDTEKNQERGEDKDASNAVDEEDIGAKPLAKSNKVPERENLLYEDWSKLALTLGMESDVELLGQIEHNGFKRELLHAQWRELDPIDLWVVRPTGVKKPPVILYLYSYPSSNDRYKDLAFCEFLTEKGFAAVGFVSALTEHRFHDMPTKQWFVSQLQAALGASVHDVQMILNYLGSRGDLDMTRVGMWGDGSGASIAIMAAAVDPRIKVLDLLNPWGDWPDWLAKSSLVPEDERADYLRPVFLKTVENLDPVKWLPELKTQQVRLQYITDGLTITPSIVRERMEGAAPSQVKRVQYQNTKAFFTDVASTGKGFDWIKEQLRPSAAAAEGIEDRSMTNASSEAKESNQ